MFFYKAGLLNIVNSLFFIMDFQILKNTMAESYTKYKQKFFLMSKIVFIIAFFYYLVVKYIKFSELRNSLINIEPLYIIIAILLLLLNILLQYFRWKYILRVVVKEKNSKKIADSLFVGFAGGLITPFQIGEYIGRNLPFSSNDYGLVTFASLIDKLIPMFIYYFFGAFSTLYFIYKFYNIPVIIILGLIALTILFFVLFCVVLLNEGILRVILRRFSRLKAIKGMLSELKVLRRIKTAFLINVFLYSLAFYLVVILQYGLWISAFTKHFDLNYFMVGSISMFIVTILSPISISGLGIRESSSIMLLNHYNISSAIAFNSSFFVFLVNVLLPSIYGAFVLIKLKKR